MLDERDALLGVVTDGDIRRGMLRGVTLDSPVTEIMNPDPKSATDRDDARVIEDIMSRHAIHHVPVVDADGRVTGLFTIDDLMRSVELSTPVVLMAGGRGERLYPLTKDTPKPMLQVGGMPLLEIILRKLRKQGFVNIYISVNYLAEKIEDYFGDGSRFGVRVRYVYEDEPLGTAGALAVLADEITEPFIVMNSDLLSEVKLSEMLSFHAKQEAAGTVGVREYFHEVPFGVIELDGARVTSMEEKPIHRSLVNTGIYALDPSALRMLTRGEYADMPTLLEKLMEAGRGIAAFPIHESWLDVGRPEDLEHAQSESGKWIDS